MPRVLSLLVGVVVGCGSHPPNHLILRYDAGGDGAADAAADGAGDAAEDVAAETDPTLGGPCVDDAQCDDGIACTYDSCDGALHRCRNVPDDTQCDDGIYCDGQEQCVLMHGCEPGAVVTCEDGNACTIDACVEATKSCTHTPRDEDGDGDPDAHCVPHHDCNDLDPTVSSLHAEVCANGKDDNCNGLVDEMPCVAAPGDTCDDAVTLGGAGTYSLSTIGCSKTFATSCTVSKPTAASTVVASVTVPPGPNVDLDVWATAVVEVAVAIDGTCGQASTELSCGSGPGATSVRARARDVSAGTYFIVVTSASETNAISLSVDMLPPSPPAMNVDCTSAAFLTPNQPVTVSVVDPTPRLPTMCTAAQTGELTYALTLSQTQDVNVYGSTVRGSGDVVLGLRTPHCTDASDEIGCAAAQNASLFARALVAGTYIVTVAGTSSIDVNLQAVLSPPTQAPADQTCIGSPAITPGAAVTFDLSGHENAIKDRCATGGPDAAYDLTLPAASDVLLIERIPSVGGEMGAVSLDTPTCARADVQVCSTLASTPVRIGKRNVSAGDYRVVVSDEAGLKGTVDVLVRPTVAPTIIPAGGADTCATAVDASAGGFFTGDTSTAHADYSDGCDAPTSSGAGAPDQVLSLALTQRQRVVLDMEGSTYATILDVHQGPDCPGPPVPNACYVGFSGARSFLDIDLDAGSYWVIVDGYGGDKGPWNLDVRVLPP